MRKFLYSPQEKLGKSWRKHEKYITFWSNITGKDFRDLGMDESIILKAAKKWILDKYVVKIWTRLNYAKWSPMAGYCNHDAELQSFIVESFLYCLNKCQLLIGVFLHSNLTDVMLNHDKISNHIKYFMKTVCCSTEYAILITVASWHCHQCAI